MRRALTCFLLSGLGFLPGVPAFADIDNSSATNVQEGDNDTSRDQSGDAASGDAVGGQVVGVVSSGDTSLDATNSTQDADIDTGDAEGRNTASSITGLIDADEITSLADILSEAAGNLQEGDNATEAAQAASVVSGDGVAGQIAGVVTSGTSDLVVANTSDDADVSTGDALFENENVSVSVLLMSGAPIATF